MNFRREMHSALAVGGLGADDDHAPIIVDQRLTDAAGAGLPVNVLPAQAEKFAASYPGAEGKDEPLAPVVGLHRCQEQRSFLQCEGCQLAFFTPLVWVGPDQLGYVARDGFQLERLAERGQQELVKLTLAGRSEAGGVQVVEHQEFSVPDEKVVAAAQAFPDNLECSVLDILG